MKVGMIGLGRMGANMARRLARAGIEVAGFDLAEQARAALAGEALIATFDAMRRFAAALPKPAIVWLMLPAGVPTP